MKSCSWRDQTWPHPSLADRTQRSDRGGGRREERLQPLLALRHHWPACPQLTWLSPGRAGRTITAKLQPETIKYNSDPAPPLSLSLSLQINCETLNTSHLH